MIVPKQHQARQIVGETLGFLKDGRVRKAALTLARGRETPELKPLAVTDVRASRLTVKNNVVAYYPQDGLVVKFRKPMSAREADSLRNEFTVLREVAEFGGLQAPEPVAYQDDPVPALWMKYIDYRKQDKRERAAIAQSVAQALLGWYDHYGVTQSTSDFYTPLQDALARGESSLLDEGWTELEATRIVSALRKLADFRIPLIFSKIHGDTGHTNCRVMKGGSVLLGDWENSRVDLVARDMVTLSDRAPAIRDMYFEWRMSHAVGLPEDVDREFALVRILRHLPLTRLRSYFTQVHFVSHEQADNKILSKKRAVLGACDSVFRFS